MNKKVIYIIAGIILIIIGILIYWLTTRPKTEKIQTNYQQFSSAKILFPTLSTNGTKIIYFNNEQEPAFYEMDTSGGNVNKLFALDTPDDVFWSSDSSQAILKVIYNQYIFEKYGSKFASPGTPDQTETTWYFDLKSNKLKKLDNNIVSVIWLSNDKIVCELRDEESGTNTLNLANPDGSDSSKLADLPDLNIYGISLAPGGQNLIVYTVPSDVSGTSIYKLDLQSKNLSKVVDLNDPIKAIALAKDEILITLNPASNNPELAILTGKSEKKLGVAATTDKTVLIDPNTILVVAKDSDNKTNIFYKVDLNTANRTLISLDPKLNVDVRYLLISPDQKTIYFFPESGAYKLEVE